MRKKLFLFLTVIFLSFNSLSFAQVQLGESAPDFTLEDLLGNKIRLGEHLSRKAVIIWITNLCDNCQKALPILEGLHKEHAAEIELLVIVQPDIDIEKARQVQGKPRAYLSFLFDAKRRVCKLYGGLISIPGICPLNNIFFIGKEGTVKAIAHYPGIEESVFKDHVRSILGKQGL